MPVTDCGIFLADVQSGTPLASITHLPAHNSVTNCVITKTNRAGWAV